MEEHAEGRGRAESVRIAINTSAGSYNYSAIKGGDFVPAFFLSSKRALERSQDKRLAILASRIETLHEDTALRDSLIRIPLQKLIAATVLTIGLIGLAGADEQKESAPKPLNVKNTFRNICGFCHEDYGRHAGKGPQLMNSQRSDDYLFDRIKNGKPGRMAAFRSIYSDDQIRQMVKFIRNLKPDVEPENP